ELEQAALRWLDFTLQRFTESGLAGLNAYSGISKQYEQDTGFLTGYAGIGLALITATTGNADWADSLLLT
ncbi:lantibiotic biosynthesis protein, partial [Shewanella abyssi]|nr:lantibiotic biosynthesis protein [Shewanella abyssi]MCL1052197.1 lantibiotic biosynthesis protein [Shewanella abyssi]